MDLKNFDWSQFTISFYYPVDVEKLYKQWATSAGLESFYIEKAIFKKNESAIRKRNELINAGDSYKWKWRHDFEVSGRVLEAKRNERLAFTFGSMHFSLDFKTTAEGSLIYLQQKNITEENKVMGHLNCRSCWIFFLTNLKSILITGVDLRDKNPDIVSSMEVGFFPKEIYKE